MESQCAVSQMVDWEGRLGRNEGGSEERQDRGTSDGGGKDERGCKCISGSNTRERRSRLWRTPLAKLRDCV